MNSTDYYETSRALKLHPSAVALYILAAQHELDQGSPSAARNLLQRGIRLNEESVELWCEYVKMELGWCEFLRRRWETLGINTGQSDPTSGVTVTEEVRAMDVDSARKEVLSGAIVKEVLKDALNGRLLNIY
jgi:U3 small nucleolar RNA-associated protein 6